MTADRAKLITDMVDYIIGNTTAIGETNADNRANANLKELGKVIQYALGIVIAEYYDTEDAYEASRVANHNIAEEILMDTKRDIEEVFVG